jgi:hypothetical protein
MFGGAAGPLSDLLRHNRPPDGSRWLRPSGQGQAKGIGQVRPQVNDSGNVGGEIGGRLSFFGQGACLFTAWTKREFQ